MKSKVWEKRFRIERKKVLSLEDEIIRLRATCMGQAAEILALEKGGKMQEVVTEEIKNG